MALTKEDLQAIGELMDAKLEPICNKLDSIEEQQHTHTASITRLENSIMQELKLLNESLPDALAKREAFEDVAARVDDHGNRIYALEQRAVNG